VENSRLVRALWSSRGFQPAGSFLETGLSALLFGGHGHGDVGVMPSSCLKPLWRGSINYLAVGQAASAGAGGPKEKCLGKNLSPTFFAANMGPRFKSTGKNSRRTISEKRGWRCRDDEQHGWHIGGFFSAAPHRFFLLTFLAAVAGPFRRAHQFSAPGEIFWGNTTACSNNSPGFPRKIEDQQPACPRDSVCAHARFPDRRWFFPPNCTSCSSRFCFVQGEISLLGIDVFDMVHVDKPPGYSGCYFFKLPGRTGG